jgi:hypothetical protein
MLVNAVFPADVPRFLLAAVVLEPLRAASGIFEDEGAAIAERDFFWPPIWALVEALGLCAGEVPFLVEPVQVRFVVGDPFLDGLLGWPPLKKANFRQSNEC